MKEFLQALATALVDFFRSTVPVESWLEISNAIKLFGLAIIDYIRDIIDLYVN